MLGKCGTPFVLVGTSPFWVSQLCLDLHIEGEFSRLDMNCLLACTCMQGWPWGRLA